MNKKIMTYGLMIALCMAQQIEASLHRRDKKKEKKSSKCEDPVLVILQRLKEAINNGRENSALQIWRSQIMPQLGQISSNSLDSLSECLNWAAQNGMKSVFEALLKVGVKPTNRKELEEDIHSCSSGAAKDKMYNLLSVYLVSPQASQPPCVVEFATIDDGKRKMISNHSTHMTEDEWSC